MVVEQLRKNQGEQFGGGGNQREENQRKNRVVLEESIFGELPLFREISTSTEDGYLTLALPLGRLIGN